MKNNIIEDKATAIKEIYDKIKADNYMSKIRRELKIDDDSLRYDIIDIIEQVFKYQSFKSEEIEEVYWAVLFMYSGRYLYLQFFNKIIEHYDRDNYISLDYYEGVPNLDSQTYNIYFKVNKSNSSDTTLINIGITIETYPYGDIWKNVFEDWYTTTKRLEDIPFIVWVDQTEGSIETKQNKVVKAVNIKDFIDKFIFN